MGCRLSGWGLRAKAQGKPRQKWRGFLRRSTNGAVGVSKNLSPTKALAMTYRPRLASLLLASTLHVPAHGQSPTPTVTQGLWEAKRRFGPDIRGTLEIAHDAGGWRAEVAGTRAPVRVSGDTVSFTLPNHGGSLIAYLSKDRSTISGHWIQPPIVSSGNEYASPIVLKRDGSGRWTGNVVPLDDTMTMYLLIRKRPDGTLGAFLRNPERNLGRQLRVDRIEVIDSAVRMIGKWNGNGAERVLGAGVLNDDGFSLFLAGRGGTFDFRKIGDNEYSDFYPRGDPAAPIRIVSQWHWGTDGRPELSATSAFPRTPSATSCGRWSICPWIH